MAQSEARQLIEDIDVLLEKDAETQDARDRLRKLREALQHVEETGKWPAGTGSPWHDFAEADGA